MIFDVDVLATPSGNVFLAKGCCELPVDCCTMTYTIVEIAKGSNRYGTRLYRGSYALVPNLFCCELLVDCCTMTYTTLEIAKLTAKGVNGTELGCIVVLMP